MKIILLRPKKLCHRYDAVDRAVRKIVRALNKGDASNYDGALPMKVQNLMPMQDLTLVNQIITVESEDEAPEAHPKTTHNAFLSKLMQLSHLSDLAHSLHLVGQFSLPIASKKKVKLYQVRLKVITMQTHGVLAPILLWTCMQDRLAMSPVITRKLMTQKFPFVQGSLYGHSQQSVEAAFHP